MKINNKTINKLILVIILFVITITINSTVLAVNYKDINNMSDSEIKALQDYVLDQYVDELKANVTANYSNTDYQNALKRVINEKERRIDKGDWNPDNGFDYNKYEPGKTGDSTKVESMAGNILRIVRNVGVVLAIIALTIIGIKYMVGSVEQRAEYKKSLIPFAIGVIILASSTTFVSIIYDTTTNVLSKNPTFDETLQSGEDAAREFLSMPGLRKDQLYSQLASVSKKREDAYYTSYFKVLINAMPSNFKDGYNKGCNEIKDTYAQGLALKSCKENFDKATDTSKKEYYAGYLLALGDTYGLIELARVY